MAKTVLLTGASGFVGYQIHQSLLARGHHVVAPIRPQTLARIGKEKLTADYVPVEDIFALDQAGYGTLCAGVDVVIHAAWYVETGKYQDSPRNLDCVRGTLSLVQGAVQAGVKHVISLGTCAEYAWPGTALSIHSPLHPKTLYASAKLSTFYLLSHYLATQNCLFSWCRLFYLYGAREAEMRLVPYLHRQLARGEVAKLSKGTQLRDFMDVADAGAMIAALVDTGQSGPINICSGQAITIRQLAEEIADHYGRRDLLEFGTAEIHPSDPMAVVGVCNFSPETA